MRYKRQRKNSYFCGPVALLNAMKFTGKQISWDKNREQLKTLCNYNQGSGVTVNNLHLACIKILDPLFKPGRIVKKPNLTYMDKALNKGQAIVLRFFHGPYYSRSGHYVLVVGKTNKTYAVVNLGNYYKTVTRVSRKGMSKMLRFTDHRRRNKYSAAYSAAWTVDRE